MPARHFLSRHSRQSIALLAATVLVAVAILLPRAAVSAGTPVDSPFDGFDDGDVSDWAFFGGNNAGGGGGALSDRPADGTSYFSTGWGGDGTASGFYGGTFKNVAEVAQVVLPADPWLNFWVLNQSDATADGYTLEVTIREDLAADGYTAGADDSFRLDTVFTSVDFDDEWRLVSAPVSSMIDLGTGGNGTIDGPIDEVVIVIAGVTGDPGAVIEVDFDQFTFTSAGPLPPLSIVFDDMEHADPGNNGWFSFNGAVGGGGIAANSADLPPAPVNSTFTLETGWGSGGASGFYGGFGRENPVDLAGTDHFNFWINPDADQDYVLEFNFQDDDNGDGAITPADDDEFQFNCAISPTGPCAIAGGGWQQVSIPFTDLFDDNSFLTGGNGNFDAAGADELLFVVVAVIGSGTDVNFRTDDWVFSDGPLAAVAPAPTPEPTETATPEPQPTSCAADAPAAAAVTAGDGPLIDDFETALAAGTDADGVGIGFITFQGAGSGVSITTNPTPPSPPLAAVGSPNSTLTMDIDSTSFAGFVNAFADDTATAWVPQDWSTSEGLSFWFCGTNSGAGLFIDVLDNRNAGSTSDDAERWSATFTDDFTGWQELTFPFSELTRKEIGNGAPDDLLGLFEVHGYAIGALGTDGPKTYYIDDVRLYGTATPASVAIGLASRLTLIDEGTTGDVVVKLNRPLGANDPATVSIDYTTERSTATPGVEFTPTSGTLTFENGGPTELSFPVETFDDTKTEGDEQVLIRLTNPVDADRTTLYQGSVLIKDNDGIDPALLDDFEQGAFLWDAVNATIATAPLSADAADARPGQDPTENVMTVGVTAGSAEISRDFPIGQDWTGTETLDFWFDGQGTGNDVVVTLKDNGAPDPGPTEWALAWSDEFNEAAGTAPNPANWTHEIGDTTPDGKNGWGNEELQYYTDDPANASTDGNGNLAITLNEADGSRECYYGPCEYESARLLSMNKAEFAYGRIETRIQVPEGQGIWPAFWSLGTDITVNPWPASGEIDIMEYVGRLPDEIFGTIHGPGYSGGASFGNTYGDFGEPVADNFHTFTVEWEPEKITWFVDGIQYHQATPADVDPNEWVFEKPFFLLLNVAIGGNFGGPVGDDATFPQSMLVDYVRVYQGPDTAERFEASFTDDVDGWQHVRVPISNFTRSETQPPGAPDDGLGLDAVSGYGFELPVKAPGEYRLDLIMTNEAALVIEPTPTATPEPTVTPEPTPEPTAEPTATPGTTPEPTATPESADAATATPAPTAPELAAVDPYSCGGSINGRVTDGSGSYQLAVSLFGRAQNVTTVFSPTVAADGTYAVSADELAALGAGSYSVSVAATDVATDLVAMLSYDIVLAHSCATSADTSAQSPLATAAAPTATAAPPPAVVVPVQVAAAPVVIQPAQPAPASVPIATTYVAPAPVVATATASTPTTSTKSATPVLAVTGSDSDALLRWGLLAIAFGALAMGSPWRQNRPRRQR